MEASPRQEIDMDFEGVLERVTESSSLDEFHEDAAQEEKSFFSNDDILGTM